jgi:hypothetical protein
VGGSERINEFQNPDVRSQQSEVRSQRFSFLINDSIITVENLGKRYSIHHERERYVALRDPTSDFWSERFSISAFNPWIMK